jgi:hypothetical protein
MDIIKKIKNCVNKLYENDSELLLRDVHELAISCKLAEYLHDEFPDFSVDCEYNRHIDEIKKLKGDKFRPDIVIHKRGTDKKNLVYIEIKIEHNTDKTKRNKNISKIKSMTRQDGEYKYELGVFIDFYKNKEDLVLKFFKDGEEIE